MIVNGGKMLIVCDHFGFFAPYWLFLTRHLDLAVSFRFDSATFCMQGISQFSESWQNTVVLSFFMFPFDMKFSPFFVAISDPC